MEKMIFAFLKTQKGRKQQFKLSEVNSGLQIKGWKFGQYNGYCGSVEGECWY